MADFNKNRFIKQKFEQRTESVSVPALAEWFDGDDPFEWVVRNLTGNEMSASQEASAKNKNIAALIEALVTSGQDEKVKALRAIIGIADDVSSDLAKRLEMIVYGSVKPEIEMDVAVKLAENFPVEFMQITNKITILTGQGALAVKPKPSGKIQPSEAV